MILPRQLNPFSEESIDITPIQFEQQAKTLFEKLGQIKDYQVSHNTQEKAHDGDYQIDIKITFDVAGMDFVVIGECKRYSKSVEREKVQVLHDKLKSLGAHKGLLISSSGFQKGAIKYAKAHGIALLKIVDGQLLYETRSRDFSFQERQRYPGLPEFAFIWLHDTPTGVSTSAIDPRYKIEELIAELLG